MSRYVYFQPNKKDLKDNYGDCVIRALCKALDMEWLEVFDEIMVVSREMQCPFDDKACYTAYLRSKGFTYTGISNKKGSKRPTLAKFAQKTKTGTHFVLLAKHAVCVQDGKYYDTYDAGEWCLYGYWTKNDK